MLRVQCRSIVVVSEMQPRTYTTPGGIVTTDSESPQRAVYFFAEAMATTSSWLRSSLP